MDRGLPKEFPLGEPADVPGRPANWITSTFGSSAVRVAVRYGSKASVDRLIALVDARTPGDALDWEIAWLEAWIEKNAEDLDAELLTSYYDRFDQSGVRSFAGRTRRGPFGLVQSFPWQRATTAWGPGSVPVRRDYLERFQLLYLVLRVLTPNLRRGDRDELCAWHE